jgi:hypothetical protein
MDFILFIQKWQAYAPGIFIASLKDSLILHVSLYKRMISMSGRFKFIDIRIHLTLYIVIKRIKTSFVILATYGQDL